MSDRRILHADMDCFYAAVHMRDDPALKGKPVVVGGSPSGRGVVAAANYEARKFGVRSAMPASRAKRLCPQLIFIRSDFKAYRLESRKIFEIFKSYTPLIQPMSLDEAYLDVTEWIGGHGSATAIAREIRRRVREERGLAVSVGVGPNKLVAKIASDFNKPDGLTVVRPDRVMAFLEPLAVGRINGVGPKMQEKLLSLGVETIGQLRERPREELEMRFGKFGRTLHAYARGEDSRPVSTSKGRKSLSHERTFARDLVGLEEVEPRINQLCDKVAEDLQRRDLAACTVTLKVRYDDFTTISRSRTLQDPFNDASVIRDTVMRLLKRTEAFSRPVRLIGIGTANLVKGGAVQLLLDFDRVREEAEC